MQPKIPLLVALTNILIINTLNSNATNATLNPYNFSRARGIYIFLYCVLLKNSIGI